MGASEIDHIMASTASRRVVTYLSAAKSASKLLLRPHVHGSSLCPPCAPPPMKRAAGGSMDKDKLKSFADAVFGDRRAR